MLETKFEASRIDPLTKSDLRRPLDRRRIRSVLLWVAGVVAVIVLGYLGFDYWTRSRFLVPTDDAYVQADYTTVAPKVAGYISNVLVRDNQWVSAGQVLARIDDRDFRAALQQALANVQSAQATISNIDAQIALQQPVIAQQAANISARQAALVFDHEDNERYQRLMAEHADTIQRTEQATTMVDEDSAKLDGAKAALLAAQRQVDVLKTERSKAIADLAHDRAVAEQAKLSLSYTVITAPVAGTVGARSLRVGEFVQAGTELMAVVPLNAVYIIANYKETQLANVRNGQPVEIKVDTFPGRRFAGHVDSLSPASGLEFSLLPPDNATGNFTKIVQRIPVKIVLDDPAMTGLLRPGMSAEPSIDTKAAALASPDGSKSVLAPSARSSIR